MAQPTDLLASTGGSLPSPSAGGRPASQTRTDLLDAGEELFLELGVDATSLRAVTARAGANLAAVSYHFGGKEGLVRAVFDRRIRPVNEQRLRRLAQLEAAHSPSPPPAEGVLRAFLEPVVRFGQDASAEPMRFRRLMGRSFAEPGERMRQRLREQFREVGERFLPVLGRCFPGLPPAVVLWRFHFMLGSMVQIALHGSLISEHSRGACDPSQGNEVLDRLIEFVLAGFGAPVERGAGAGEAAGAADSRAAPGGHGGASIFAWEEGY